MRSGAAAIALALSARRAPPQGARGAGEPALRARATGGRAAAACTAPRVACAALGAQRGAQRPGPSRRDPTAEGAGPAPPLPSEPEPGAPADRPARGTESRARRSRASGMV